MHIAPNEYGYGIRDDAALFLEGALRKFPNIKILGHSADWSRFQTIIGGYPASEVLPGGRVVELMRKYPNLLGIFPREAGNAAPRQEFGVKFLNEFQDKLYFGHDFCSERNLENTTLSIYIDSLLDEGLISREVYDKVCYKTRKSFLSYNTNIKTAWTAVIADHAVFIVYSKCSCGVGGESKHPVQRHYPAARAPGYRRL